MTETLTASDLGLTDGEVAEISEIAQSAASTQQQQTQEQQQQQQQQEQAQQQQAQEQAAQQQQQQEQEQAAQQQQQEQQQQEQGKQDPPALQKTEIQDQGAAPLPVADETRLGEIDTEIQNLETQSADLAKKFQDGEIEFTQYHEQAGKLVEQKSALANEKTQSETNAQINEQNVGDSWDRAQKQFFNDPQNRPFAMIEPLKERMSKELKDLGASEEGKNMSYEDALNQARDKVFQDAEARTEVQDLLGIDIVKLVTDPAAQQQQQQQQQDKNKQQQQSQQQQQTGPVTLGNMSAELNNLGDEPGNTAEHMDRLEAFVEGYNPVATAPDQNGNQKVDISATKGNILAFEDIMGEVEDRGDLETFAFEKLPGSRHIASLG